METLPAGTNLSHMTVASFEKAMIPTTTARAHS